MTGIAGITRKAAVCAALLTGAIAIGAGPAHAASTDPPVDGTPVPAYSVDDDPIAIDGNFMVFSGAMKITHDGSHVRANLTGTVRATQSDRCSGIEVTFTYADGTQDASPRDNAPNPCGTSPASVNISSPNDRDVVKYRYYTRATGTHEYFVSYSPTAEGLVGDAPASDGTCNLLDRDGVSSSGAGVPTFSGRATYGCVTSNGNTTVAVSGSMDKRLVPSGSTGGLVVVFSYADGTTSVQRTAGGTPKVQTDKSGSYYVYPVSATSDSAKDVRSVSVRSFSQPNGTLQGPVFAPQSSANTSWFGTFSYS